MKISILTLFPNMFNGPFDESIIKRGQEKGLIQIKFIDIRDFGIGTHKSVDDTSYGGGTGMILRVDVVKEAIDNTIDKNIPRNKQMVILLSAAGKKFTQKYAEKFADLKHLILICGHYEGVDYRIKNYIDEEISIGDYVLTGGEIPAMVITDAVLRLVPEVLKNDATAIESFSESGLLEHPQYTKPQEFEGVIVPKILLSGNHKKIETWRKEEAAKLTKKIRPDLKEKKM